MARKRGSQPSTATKQWMRRYGCDDAVLSCSRAESKVTDRMAIWYTAARVALSDGYDMPVKLSNRVSCQEEVWSIYSPTAYVHDILVGACEGGFEGMETTGIQNIDRK